jgi:hypothetical protein
MLLIPFGVALCVVAAATIIGTAMKIYRHRDSASGDAISNWSNQFCVIILWCVDAFAHRRCDHVGVFVLL